MRTFFVSGRPADTGHLQGGNGLLHLNETPCLKVVVAVGNRASQRVAEKVGVPHEGVLRHRLRMGDVSTDAHMYSLLPDDVVAPPSSCRTSLAGCALYLCQVPPACLCLA